MHRHDLVDFQNRLQAEDLSAAHPGDDGQAVFLAQASVVPHFHPSIRRETGSRPRFHGGNAPLHDALFFAIRSSQ
jgi:hypothetical protein